MSEDELAEVLAVSRKMLRKKSRQQILDMVYDKTGIGDNTNLPKWFVEDEKKHHKKIPMVSKEDIQVFLIQRERDRIAVLNNVLPKKVWEYKMRKKKRFIESLKKARKQSEQVIDNNMFTPLAKAREVRTIYRKAMKKNKPKPKETIVGINFIFFDLIKSQKILNCCTK